MSDFTTQFSRISHHTVALSATTLFTGSTFTVPGSESIDENWSIYDLALSEIGVDEFRDKAYIRIGSNIKEINLGTGTTVTTPTLNQVLTADNTTSGKDVEVTSGDIIKGQTQGELDFALGGVKLTLSLDNTLNESIIIEPNIVTIQGSSSANIGVGNALVQVTTTNEEDFRFNTYAFKTIDMGPWDLENPLNTLNIAHGLSATEWKTINNITGWYRDDLDALYRPLGSPMSFLNGGTAAQLLNYPHVFQWTSTNIVLEPGGLYTNIATGNWNDTGSYNRGKIRFQYIPD